MPGLTNDFLADLVTTTLANLPTSESEFETLLEMNHFEFTNSWFTEDRRSIEGGTSIQRFVQLGSAGTARLVLPYERHAANVVDTMDTIDVPWRIMRDHFSFDRHELLQNMGRSKIINLVKTRRRARDIGYAEKLEDIALNAPPSPSDKRHPWGLKYWLNKRDNASTGIGFDGKTIRYGDGSTSTNKAGIDPTMPGKSRWQNLAGTYTGFNEELIDTMRKFFTMLKFTPPMTAEDMREGSMARYRIYMGIDEYTEYERVATKANDNYGPDLAPFHGVTTFKRVPIVRLPGLDNDTDDAIMFVNRDRFTAAVLGGEWLREEEPMRDVEQPDVLTMYLTSRFNIFTENVREAGGVIHKVASASSN